MTRSRNRNRKQIQRVSRRRVQRSRNQQSRSIRRRSTRRTKRISGGMYKLPPPNEFGNNVCTYEKLEFIINNKLDNIIPEETYTVRTLLNTLFNNCFNDITTYSYLDDKKHNGFKITDVEFKRYIGTLKPNLDKEQIRLLRRLKGLESRELYNYISSQTKQNTAGFVLTEILKLEDQLYVITEDKTIEFPILLFTILWDGHKYTISLSKDIKPPGGLANNYQVQITSIENTPIPSLDKLELNFAI
jgi:hypothetical protein